jgi:hypothetical protein
MYARPSGLGLHVPLTHQQWRQVFLRVLDTAALHTVSPAGLHLQPVPPETFPPSPIAAALEPFRRRLWRRRALLVLTRAALLCLLWLAGVSVTCRLWFGGLIWPATAPAGVIAATALWLAFAQRPTLGETARLLDRTFRLHDQLGTAVELGLPTCSDSLAARQVRRAATLLGRIPSQPWLVPVLRQGERALMIGLAIVVAGAVLSMPSPRSAATSPRPVAHSRARTVHPRRAAPEATGRLRAAVSHAASAPQIAPTAVPPAVQPFTLAASLQVHTGPQTVPAQATQPGGTSPSTLPTSLPGASGQIHGRNDQTSGSGANPTPSPRHATTAKKSTPGSRGSTPGQARAGASGQNTALQGQGDGAGPPAPAQGQHAARTGTLGQPAAPQDGNAPPVQNVHRAGKQGANTSGASHTVNPFGPAPAAHGMSSNGKSGIVSSRRAQRGAGAGSNGTAIPTKSGTHAGTPNTGESANKGSLLPATGRRNAPGGAVPTQSRRLTPSRQAGAATGPQITLGGQPAVTGGPGQGFVLVRVVPLNASAASAQAGSLALGPGQAQGYVPEDSTQFTPAEQALLRAYFSQGSN